MKRKAAVGVPVLAGVLGLAVGRLKCRGAGPAPPGVRLDGISVGHFGKPVDHRTPGFASTIAGSGAPTAAYDPFDPLTTRWRIPCAQNTAVVLCS